MNPWGLATCLLLFSVSLVSAQETKPRPNIILVMADDLGWSDLGCYGGEIDTPHIDSLAREGLRFTQFYNNAVCGPTRASLLTGLYCQQVGHRGDHWNEPKDFSKCITIAEALQLSGYQTMMVGKWQGRDLAVDRGFQHFFGPMCQAKISYFHEVNDNPYYLNRKQITLPADFYLTDAINDYAVRFLKQSLTEEKPFFLYVAHIAPHWPLHAREKEISCFRKRYRNSGWDQARSQRFLRQKQTELIPEQWKLSPRPAAIPAWEQQEHQHWQAERMAVYATQVSAIDRGLGQILQILKDTNAVENTLVIFLSDNGAAPDGGLSPSLSGFGFKPDSTNTDWRKDGVEIRPGSSPSNPPGPHDTFAAYGLAWANVSNTPLRGTKLEAYEGGIRTPLVARWPAVIREEGSITRQPGHVIDLMATCLDIANTPYPASFQGRIPLPLEGKSLLPIFQGQQRESHKTLCWDVPRHQAIRMGSWKAIRPRSQNQWQLFNLDEDGTESADLSAREPERVKMMSKEYARWYKRVTNN
ncbi:arylsulfatase [Gimesia sp.]|uniref:arylsulfatase n=1 Tax=Gimesia sp. TaxID=2024833 RepID=UPI003A8F2FBF